MAFQEPAAPSTPGAAPAGALDEKSLPVSATNAVLEFIAKTPPEAVMTFSSLARGYRVDFEQPHDAPLKVSPDLVRNGTFGYYTALPTGALVGNAVRRAHVAAIVNVPERKYLRSVQAGHRSLPAKLFNKVQNAVRERPTDPLLGPLAVKSMSVTSVTPNGSGPVYHYALSAFLPARTPESTETTATDKPKFEQTQAVILAGDKSSCTAQLIDVNPIRINALASRAATITPSMIAHICSKFKYTKADGMVVAELVPGPDLHHRLLIWLVMSFYKYFAESNSALFAMSETVIAQLSIHLAFGGDSAKDPVLATSKAGPTKQYVVVQAAALRALLEALHSISGADKLFTDIARGTLTVAQIAPSHEVKSRLEELDEEEGGEEEDDDEDDEDEDKKVAMLSLTVAMEIELFTNMHGAVIAQDRVASAIGTDDEVTMPGPKPSVEGAVRGKVMARGGY